MNEDEKASVRAFLLGRLSFKGEDTAELKDSESLFLSTRLDSLDAMETVVFLEENHGIDFAEIGFDKSLIDSPEAIFQLKQQQSPQAKAR